MLLSKTNIDTIDINKIIDYVPLYERVNFINEAGKEHYRLLAYISTLFNNNKLLDIGTRYGSSAVALSYNESNIVDTFDIVNEIDDKVKRKSNINFHQENIFNSLELILSYPVILLDIDPHDGILEQKLINYLINNKYQGILILDDISTMWPDMNKLWTELNIKKFDITHIGHISGTGLIDFSNKIKVE